ncbi:hypothetical protein CA13_56400 [Planctomycetes bacterium CA13]|uniref:Uncharacterized protein n=1 Tax=Novipirellula herctigrandis TaxID=2527986 RepID=A0A5C5ZA11_9BACT|nr:hypothetical protein CA13_56400 [Planctomycetes bacterium CA13]
MHRGLGMYQSANLFRLGAFGMFPAMRRSRRRERRFIVKYRFILKYSSLRPRHVSFTNHPPIHGNYQHQPGDG